MRLAAGLILIGLLAGCGGMEEDPVGVNRATLVPIPMPPHQPPVAGFVPHAVAKRPNVAIVQNTTVATPTVVNAPPAGTVASDLPSQDPMPAQPQNPACNPGEACGNQH